MCGAPRDDRRRRRAGADTVKFQTFVPRPGQRRGAQRPTTSNATTRSRKPIWRAAATHWTSTVNSNCSNTAGRGIDFLSSPFDGGRRALSPRTPATAAHQARLGQIDQCPLLWQLATAGVDLILSTGMATLDEIHQALACAVWRWTASHRIRRRMSGCIRLRATARAGLDHALHHGLPVPVRPGKPAGDGHTAHLLRARGRVLGPYRRDRRSAWPRSHAVHASSKSTSPSTVRCRPGSRSLAGTGRTERPGRWHPGGIAGPGTQREVARQR